VVFDKTGTLTTGQSEVESSEGISAELWQRVYLLEKYHGAQHPLANAITQWYEKEEASIMFNAIDEVIRDNSGLSASVQNRKIHIGDADFFSRNEIIVPRWESIQLKTARGYTPLYVAEDGIFQGVIFVKHASRKDIAASLLRLKQEGKKIIMLTGDNHAAALGFNKQNGSLFDEEDIHAEQKPADKQNFLEKLMNFKDHDAKGVWFVGDGLNDAPCARVVTEKGGISCAITAQDKAAFFTDISLNGSLDYLFQHNGLNGFMNKAILQNQSIMAYSALASLAFIITFSILGIAVSPLIPTLLMVATTLFTVFNSYRAKLSVEVALDKNASLFKQALASDVSLALLLITSTFLIAAILLATIATGGLALPVITFTSGIALAISSGFLLATVGTFATFVVVGIGYLVAEWLAEPDGEEVLVEKPVFECGDNEAIVFDYVPSSVDFKWGSLGGVRGEPLYEECVDKRISII
jgi:Cu+-exporting ATPase